MVLVVALAPIVAYMALQLPALQSMAASRATKVLSNNLDAQVVVERVYFVFFKKLIMGNVYILSPPSDTLLHVQKLSITFSHVNPFARKAMLTKALLQGGFFHLEIEEGRRTNLEKAFKIERGKRTPRDSTSQPLLLSIKEFSLRDFRFTLKDERRSRQGASPWAIDFMNMDVMDINLDAKKIHLLNDTLFCSINSLSAVEKSGYVIHKLSADVAVCSTGTGVFGLEFVDPWSVIRADAFYMHYNSARDFRTFVDSVRLEAHFNNAFLDFRSLKGYAPAMTDNQLCVYISGHVEGPVRYLKSSGLELRSSTGATCGEMAFRIMGLPNVPATTAFLDIHQLHSKAGDIAHILYQIKGMDPEKMTQVIPPSSSIQLEGRLAGLLTNFAANGTLSTDVGDIYFDAVLFQEKERGFHINGHLGTNDFHLEGLMGKPFGKLTMHTHTDATLGNKIAGGFEARIDSLRIDQIEINDYPYSQILANGKYENQRFDGRVVCSDPNLNFIFQGLANLNYREFRADQTSRYDFHADIAYADLAAIGIDSRDSISRFSGSLRANFYRSITEDVIGSILIQDAGYTNSRGRYDLGEMRIDSEVSDSAYHFTLSAPFANAEYEGQKSIPTFIKEMRRQALGRYLPNYFKPNEEHTDSLSPPSPYRLTVTVGDMLAMGQFALPGLYIAPETHLSATLMSNDSLFCSLQSKYIRYNEQKASDIHVDCTGDSLAFHSTINALDFNAFGQTIDTINLHVSAAMNKVELLLDYANESGENRGGMVHAYMHFTEDEFGERAGITIDVAPSYFVINRAKWALIPSSILLSQNKIHFNELKLYNGDQSLTVDGTLDRERSDTLNISLHKFDISLANLFMEKRPHRFAGTLTGNAKVIDFYQNRQFSMDLKGSDIFVNSSETGDISIACLWDHQEQRFAIEALNTLEGRTPAWVNGFYYPDSKYLNLSASMKNFSASPFEPFLSSLISNLHGDVSGNMNLKGTIPHFYLTSNRIDVNDVGFTINFTKVPYKLDGPFVLHEDGFSAQNCTLTDQYGNTGVVNGGLKYRYFRDITIDTALDFSNMLCLATKEKDNDSFYGDVFATGRLHITGNLKQVNLDILARTDKNSTLHIPLSNASEAKQSTLLSFVPAEEPPPTPVLDPLDTIKIREKGKELTQIAVALNAEVTPDAEVLIEVNKATGNVISGFGAGNISLGIDPAKSLFDIFGDYTLSNGDYQFVLQGIVKRKFFVIPGGKITFNGDILKTNLDLTAAYRTKSSINTLIANNNAAGNLRDIECQIRMNGNMLNPNLGFNIEVADLAPEVRSRVQAAFTPEDKLIRQFMAILVTGGFLPDQNSGVIRNTSILYSNATEILTSQLNNIFGQLNIPLDVGFNYQPGDKGRDIYDVAVSMQLFNNRLVVNGNAGNSQTAGTTGDIGGNIDIELKVTDNGNFRLKAFSHASDQYSSYNDLGSPQRNGGGITYQEEFNTFRELFQRIFVRKKRRAPEGDKL